MKLKTLERGIEFERYVEFYFGIGFGYTDIAGRKLLILPFVIILLVEKGEVWK